MTRIPGAPGWYRRARHDAAGCYLLFGYAAAGRWSDAMRERALIEREPDNSPEYCTMVGDLAFGEYDAALVALEKGVANREPMFYGTSLGCDPMFNPLKGNPRYVALMQRLGTRICPAYSSNEWPIKTRPH